MGWLTDRHFPDCLCRLKGAPRFSLAGGRLEAEGGEPKATVLVLHHLRKATASERLESRVLAERLSPENARGSSAIEGRARFILTMTSLLTNEAVKVDLAKEEAAREAYVVVASAKQNNSAKGSWLMLERGAPRAADAGLLHVHPDSNDLVAQLRGTGPANPKRKVGPPRHSLLLQAIAYAGGLKQVNRDAVLACLWPGEPLNTKRWYKLLDSLREKELLSGTELTPLAWATLQSSGTDGE